MDSDRTEMLSDSFILNMGQQTGVTFDPGPSEVCSVDQQRDENKEE